MSHQRRLMPSISMLIAFDSAARMGSFTAAAGELNLTQGAVSKQLSALENQLDVMLFHRSGKSVGLTETGKVYAQEVHKILQDIRAASLNAMTGPLNAILNLAILPTFGTRWLMPRFPDFLQENPDITVNFVTRLSPFDFHSENIHAAIHYGSADWPGTNSIFLMSEEAIPVCSPKFMLDHHLQRPADLAKVPLLRLASRANAWQQWLQDEGCLQPIGMGMLFEQFSIIAKAAIAGLGAALLPRFLIQSELDRGDLVILSDKPLKNNAGYYLVMPDNKSEYAPVVALRAWLLKTIAID